MKIKNKGFTLVELLAVIIILGLLIMIAIPGVTKYINQSRKRTLTKTINNYISAIINDVNDMKYHITDKDIIYAIPIECISLERGGKNPFGEWMQATNNYFAYVLVQYNADLDNYTYGFTFRDSAGFGIYPTTQKRIKENGEQIQTGLIIERPLNGTYTNFTSAANWQSSGFDVKASTQIRVLTSTNYGEKGNGVSTCTLARKGNNYEEIKTMIKYTMIEQGEVTSEDDYFLNSGIKRKDIESIQVVSHLDVPAGAKFFDLSSTLTGSILGWSLDSDGDNLAEVYIGSDGKIKLGEDSSYLFSYLSNAETIDLSLVDTSDVIDMSSMFYLSIKVKNLDLSNFNTTNVRNMSSMFSNCHNLESVNIVSFKTSKVTDMSYMFVRCYKLKSVDLSHFDTSRVTNMLSFFNRCYELESVNLSGFDTSQVTDMHWMFQHCPMLTKLDLSSFDIRNVTMLEKMFQYDEKLTCIQVGPNWQYNKSANKNSMFNKAGTSTPTLNACN